MLRRLQRLQRLQLAQPTRDALLKEKQDMIANYHRGGAAANMVVQRLWGRGAGIASQRCLAADDERER